jgi:hypothetical protein
MRPAPRPPPRALRAAWAALGALAALAGPAALAAPAPAWAPLELPASVDALLRTGRWDSTPSGFRIVALSVLADGCAAAARRDPALHAAALACVDRALRLADATRPPRGPEAGAGAADQGLWRSHLDLLLGARDQLGPCADPARHRRLAEALAARSLREPTHHVPSYPGVRARWPADQTATLAGLGRYDRAHGAHLAEAPLRAWRDWVLAHAMDAKLGLPWSEATGHAPGARAPRGCALAWQTRYLAELDPALARRWWSAFREHYLVDRLVLVGFREWPPGVERAADADSGPIVNGVGAAATAFAIPAARLMGDGALAGRLEATAATVAAAAAASPKLRSASHTVLAEAIRWMGQQVREPRPAQP